MWTNDEVVANTDSKSLPVAPTSQTSWIPGSRSLLSDATQVTWEVLINNILKSISDLNYSAKNDIKVQYLHQAGQIVVAIRDMLACSGTVSSKSVVVTSNKALVTYHQNIMASLSKIILSAKVAAGLWPPPDAVHSMRYQAGQVLLAVRHFIAVAQEAGVPLTPLPDLEADEFDVRGTELSDLELLQRLDHNCEIIMNSIAALVTKITRDRSLSTALIDHVRKTITEIGQFMSLVEDIQFDKSLDVDNLVEDFMQKKEQLYMCVNELVTASSTGQDGFAPANALGMMLESSTSVLEAVEEVVVSSKLLIDHKELISQKSFADSDHVNAELVELQKRAQSLNFLEMKSTSPRSAQPLSATPSYAQSWSRDGRTLSSDSRTYNDSSRKHTSNSSTGSQSHRMSHENILSPPPDSAGSSGKFFDDGNDRGRRTSDVSFCLG